MTAPGEAGPEVGSPPSLDDDALGQLARHVVPDHAGKEHGAHREHLVLFGVLKRADPALVVPGLTAEFECLHDDVRIGR